MSLSFFLSFHQIGEILIRIFEVPFSMEHIHKTVIVHQAAIRYIHNLHSKSILEFFKECLLLCSTLFIFVNTFQIICMTRLTHLDIDVAALVETDIKILPESRQLDIAIVTLDGDCHFLTLGTSPQATNICLHQNLKRHCKHLTLHEWHLSHVLLHYNLSVLQ